MRPSVRITLLGDMSWFLGEKGSIEGGMTRTLDASIHEGTYSGREKM